MCRGTEELTEIWAHEDVKSRPGAYEEIYNIERTYAHYIEYAGCVSSTTEQGVILRDLPCILK